MSLLKWSTPERRRADKVLPIIPNEIYLRVFESIAPSNERLPPEKLKIFHRLSRVCKFFANVCLPRVFESVEISSFISQRTGTAHTYKASLGFMFCAQISEKQPLALMLAQTVRACHFTNPKTPDVYSRTLDLFTLRKNISAATLMKNVRELHLSNYAVEPEHWSMIAALPSLADLSFHTCQFGDGPSTDVDLKVSRLSVVDCDDGDLYPIEAADLEFLRILAMPFGTLEESWCCDGADWLLESAITELHFHADEEEVLQDLNSSLHFTLTRMPRSLEVLSFSVKMLIVSEHTLFILAGMLDDPAWKDLSSLRSFTVRAVDGTPVTDKLSRSINDGLPGVRRILHDKFEPASGHVTNLRHVEIFGTVFHLVDGLWSEVAL